MNLYSESSLNLNICLIELPVASLLSASYSSIPNCCTLSILQCWKLSAVELLFSPHLDSSFSTSSVAFLASLRLSCDVGASLRVVPSLSMFIHRSSWVFLVPWSYISYPEGRTFVPSLSTVSNAFHSFFFYRVVFHLHFPVPILNSQSINVLTLYFHLT